MAIPRSLARRFGAAIVSLDPPTVALREGADPWLLLAGRRPQ